jgi:hypothetical protein
MRTPATAHFPMICRERLANLCATSAQSVNRHSKGIHSHGQIPLGRLDSQGLVPSVLALYPVCTAWLRDIGASGKDA